MLIIRIIGASLSEPHTSESNGGIFIYRLYICRTSFRKSKFTLLTETLRTPNSRCGRNIEKNTWSKYTLPYSSLESYYATSLEVLPLSEFYLHRLRLCYPWIPIPVLEELSSSRRNKKSLKIGDGPELECCRDFGTKEEKAKGERSC